jgi:polar amino acid transport system permease protein
MDIMGVVRGINARTYQFELFFLVAGLIYLTITIVFTQLFKLVERWLKVEASRKR